jgi:hypothetical protein
MSRYLLLELTLATTFDLLHHFLLCLPVLLEFLASSVVMFTMLLGFSLLLTQLEHLRLKLLPEILINVVIVLAKGLKRVQDLAFEPERYPPRTIRQPEK